MTETNSYAWHVDERPTDISRFRGKGFKLYISSYIDNYESNVNITRTVKVGSASLARRAEKNKNNLETGEKGDLLSADEKKREAE